MSQDGITGGIGRYDEEDVELLSAVWALDGGEVRPGDVGRVDPSD